MSHLSHSHDLIILSWSAQDLKTRNFHNVLKQKLQNTFVYVQNKIAHNTDLQVTQTRSNANFEWNYNIHMISGAEMWKHISWLDLDQERLEIMNHVMDKPQVKWLAGYGIPNYKVEFDISRNSRLRIGISD